MKDVRQRQPQAEGLVRPSVAWHGASVWQSQPFGGLKAAIRS